MATNLIQWPNMVAPRLDDENDALQKTLAELSVLLKEQALTAGQKSAAYNPVAHGPALASQLADLYPGGVGNLVSAATPTIPGQPYQYSGAGQPQSDADMLTRTLASGYVNPPVRSTEHMGQPQYENQPGQLPRELFDSFRTGLGLSQEGAAETLRYATPESSLYSKKLAEQEKHKQATDKRTVFDIEHSNFRNRLDMKRNAYLKAREELRYDPRLTGKGKEEEFKKALSRLANAYESEVAKIYGGLPKKWKQHPEFKNTYDNEVMSYWEDMGDDLEIKKKPK